MYLTIISESLHGNKQGFISLTIEEVESDLLTHLGCWDSDYSKEEISFILEHKRGFVDEKSKSCVEVVIREISPGDAFDLD